MRLHSSKRHNGRAVSVRTGLSITVAGYLLSVELDQASMRGKVVSRRIDRGTASAVEEAACRASAVLLSKKAMRLLGPRWVVRSGYETPRTPSAIEERVGHI